MYIFLFLISNHSHQHPKEFRQFLFVAYGSLAELETHLQIAVRLEYLDEQTANQLLNQTDEVSRMLNGLVASLEKEPGL